LAQDASTERGFRPFVVRTDNIAKELVSTAANYGVKASSLDFNLLEVQTFLAKGDNAESEEEVSSDELVNLNDKALLADSNIHIRQLYEIEVVKADKNAPFSKLNISIGANSSMSRLFASIKPGSVLTYYEGIENDFRAFINRRKLRAHMFVGFWNGKLAEEIEKFIAKVHVEGTLNVQEKISFEVGCALEPIDTVDDKLIIHYLDADDKEELEKVDHSKRGFVHGVTADEIVIEYIKAKKGEPGRNCRGEFIDTREPVIANAPSFNVTDKIEVVENDERIQYKAIESGYIVFENNTYDIKIEMDVTEISFKTTGSIDAGVDTDVSINVKEADAFKDAIGAGMEVEVNEINVDGNVGNNAKIKARKVGIEGQTHQSSYIEADDIKVNIHKGKIKGKNVEISRLEQGIVEAEYVEVFQATGGKIIAKEVVIDTLASHVSIIASSKIEIKHLKGSENSFTISPILYEEDKKALSGNEDELTLQRRKIRELEDEVIKKQKVLKDNEGAIADLKKRLAHYQKSGAKVPGSFVAKFKEFQDFQKHLLSLKKELKQNEDMLALLMAKTDALQDDVLKAKIINHDSYQGHNEIHFKLVEPDIELYHVPTGGSDEKCFMLKRDEKSGAYEIIGSGKF